MQDEIQLAAKGGDVDKVWQCLQAGVDVNCKNKVCVRVLVNVT